MTSAPEAPRAFDRVFPGWRPVVVTTIAACILTGIAVYLLWPQFHAAGWVQDEALLLVYPQRMLAGAVPQRDFQSLYGPGDLWLLTIVYHVAGLTVTVERWVGLVFRISIVLAMFATARRWGLVPAILSGLISMLAFPQLGLGAYAWLGALAIALWALWLMQRSSTSPNLSTHGWFVAGVLSGLTLLFRPDLVLALGLASLVFLSMRANLERAWFIGGAALGVFPFLIHMAMAGVRAVVRNLVLDAVFRIHSGRKLPLPTRWGLQSVEFWLLFFVALWLVVLGVIVWRRESSESGRVYLAYGLFSLALLSQPVQRADLTHTNFVACVILALVPVALAGAVRQFSERQLFVAAAAIPIGIGILWGQWSLDRPYRHPTSAPVTVNGRTFPVPDKNQAATLEWMLGDVNKQTHDGDRLFVGPTDLSRTPLNDTYLYFLLPKLTPATYFLEMNPGSANVPGSRLGDDLTSADFVILDDVYMYWGEPNTADQSGDTAANQVLKQLFCPAGDYGAYHVLIRCHAGG